MRSLLILMGLLGAVGASFAWARPASACSCVTTPIYHSDPQDGAVGVPRNQALAIEGVFAASSVRLENEQGEAVPFELNAGPWPGCPGTSADVIPTSPLQPLSKYVLRVEALVPEALSDPGATATIRFTTGDTLLPDVSLDVPRIVATVVRDAPAATCGIANTVFACIGTGDTTDVELIARRGQTVLLRTTTLVQNDAVFGLPAVPDCVELRRRSPTGQRSLPQSICGDGLRTRAWSAADSPENSVDCTGGVIGAGGETGSALYDGSTTVTSSNGGTDQTSSRGCAVGRDGMTPLPCALAGLTVLAMSRARRRAARSG